MQSSKRILVLLGALLLGTSLLKAQTATGSISGAVQDESRAVVPNANVVITNVDTGVSRSLTTDGAGRYHAPGLLPGHYEVQAQAEGFQTAVRKGIQLTVGSELAIHLSLQVGQVAQTTIVTAEAPLVETVTNTLSGLVDDRAIRDLPLNGRSFDQLISLQSAAPTIQARVRTSLTGSANVFSVSGARTQSNQYLMDGTEVVGAGSVTTQPGGVLGTNMGVEAIREFQVLTSNYSAAYGKRSGGVINIATRSGTNQIHGSAFEFHRNDNLDARNFFDVDPANPLERSDPPEFKRNQFGGALGGPLLRDKSFFFGTYEGLREALGLTSLSIVPDGNARLGCLPAAGSQVAGCPAGFRRIAVNPAVVPYLGLFPAPNGRNFGDGSAESLNFPTRPGSQDFSLVRVDHRFSDRDALFGRYNFSDARVVNSEPNPNFQRTDENRDQIAMIEYKRTYATLLNSFRFGYTRGSVFTDSLPAIEIDPSLRFLEGAKTVGTITFSSTAAGGPYTETGTSTGAERHFVVNQFDWQDMVYYYRGAHSFQFGAQVQRIQHNENFQNSLRGAFQFDDLDTFLTGRPVLFRAPSPTGSGDATKAYRMSFYSAFGQDDYKVTPRLTLNLGLRYEKMSVPTEASGDRISNFHTQSVNGQRVLETNPHLGSPFFQSHNNIFAPRVGFAWDMSGNGTTAIRGGFGIFYDQIENEFRFFTSNNAPFFSLTDVGNAPFPLGFSAGPGASRAPTPDAIDFNLDVPTRLHWNFGVQRQITPNTVFNANYVGSQSYHLTRNSDANTRVPQIQPDGRKRYVGGPRKNPALGGSRVVSSDVNSSYHSLQLDFNQRLTRGLRSKFSFTYAKNIDDASATITNHALGGAQTTQDPDDPRGDRGLSAYDVRRNLVVNFNYEVPSGNWTGAAKTVLGGWQLGTILTIQDGTPFTAQTGFSRSGDQARSLADRTDLRPGAGKNPVLGGPYRYFDTSAFVLQPVGFYGNLGRNTLIGPGVVNFDFNLVKETQLSERMRLDFRAEFFNLFNHANFFIPDNSIFQTNGNVRGAAGRIQSTTTTSRQIQFGLKLLF